MVVSSPSLSTKIKTGDRFKFGGQVYTVSSVTPTRVVSYDDSEEKYFFTYPQLQKHGAVFVNFSKQKSYTTHSQWEELLVEFGKDFLAKNSHTKIFTIKDFYVWLNNNPDFSFQTRDNEIIGTAPRWRHFLGNVLYRFRKEGLINRGSWWGTYRWNVNKTFVKNLISNF